MENLLQAASIEDARDLAEMNRMLIEDEGSDNPMTIDELEARIKNWLENNIYQAVFITRNDEIVGYLLYKEERDEYDREQFNILIRQFFIKRTYRRRGIGRSAFEQVVHALFSPDATIVLEVINSNIQGRTFWERLGFEPFYTTYRRRVNHFA